MRVRMGCVLMFLGLSLAQMDEVAIIGGGIAGVTTALEILRQHPGTNVHLFELSPSLSLSTSSLIAASISFDEMDQFWGEVEIDLVDGINRLLPEDTTVRDVREGLDFATKRAFEVHRARDPRLLDSYAEKFFNASLDSLRSNFVVNHPNEICAAVFGAWCCDSNPSIVEANGGNCSSPVGLYHILETQSICDDISLTEATALGYDVLDASETATTLSDFLVGENPKCSIVEPSRSGYARGEVMFPLLLAKLNADPDVTPVLSCQVTSLTPVNAGSQVTVSVTGSGCATATTLTFDRVVITAGAASKTLLSSIDREIDWQILPLAGYILTGNPVDVPDTPFVSAEQRTLGVQIEDNSRNLQAAFARSTADGLVRIAGGAEIGLEGSDLTPPHPYTSTSEEIRIFSATNVSRELLLAPNTVKTTGVRPVSYFGNVPLIKQYVGSNRQILLNSGFGFQGWVMAWKAAELTADLLEDRKIDEAAFADAFTLELSSEHNSTCDKYADEPRGSTFRYGIGAAIGGGFGLVVIIIYYGSLCCCRCGCLSKIRDWMSYHRSLGVLIAGMLLVLFTLSVGLGLDYGYSRTCELRSQCGPNQTCQYGRCLCDEGLCFNALEDECLLEETEKYDQPFDSRNVGDVVFVVGMVLFFLILIVYLRRTRVDNLAEWREREDRAKKTKKGDPMNSML